MQVTAVGLDAAETVARARGVAQDGEVLFNRPLRQAQVQTCPSSPKMLCAFSANSWSTGTTGSDGTGNDAYSGMSRPPGAAFAGPSRWAGHGVGSGSDSRLRAAVPKWTRVRRLAGAHAAQPLQRQGTAGQDHDEGRSLSAPAYRGRHDITGRAGDHSPRPRRSPARRPAAPQTGPSRHNRHGAQNRQDHVGRADERRPRKRHAA